MSMQNRDSLPEVNSEAFDLELLKVLIDVAIEKEVDEQERVHPDTGVIEPLASTLREVRIYMENIFSDCTSEAEVYEKIEKTRERLNRDVEADEIRWHALQFIKDALPNR